MSPRAYLEKVRTAREPPVGVSLWRHFYEHEFSLPAYVQAMALFYEAYQWDFLIVFVVGAFFAGIGGSLYAHYVTFIDPSSFTVTESITILLMVIFGGMGSIQGSVSGAVILVVIPELLRFLGVPSSVAAPLRQMIYGLLLVVLIIKRPQGIMGTYKWR